MVRQAVVAGQFYDYDFDDLDKQIKQCFTSKFGPGGLPVRRDNEKHVKAIIVPHAGYFFSGSCAAWAYKELAESHFPRTYVLLGFSHQGLPSGISIEDWKTPFGIIKTNKSLAIELKENTSLDINEIPHQHEHSIEVQLPFLQFVNKDLMKEIKILAISISRDIDFKILGEEIAKVMANKDVVYIVSSDFTHYGSNYGYLPFTSDIEKRLNELDKGAIDLIKNLNISGFSEYINRTHITICGYYPILLLMKILSMEETKPLGSLLMHYTSGDIMKDHKNSVSYVSILFK
ncbi:AmmeMemoRadiSam system protein B [Candidatus Woesearchaeota archaeon]|nr:AmmeMemoRadiSam system protein B [Candidatus Woesearchaeota archaeon]